MPSSKTWQLSQFGGYCSSATNKRCLYSCLKCIKVKNSMWHLEWEGSQLSLEGFQRCLAHNWLGKLVPQEDSSKEKFILVTCGRCRKRVSWPLLLLVWVDRVKIGSAGMSTSWCAMRYSSVNRASYYAFAWCPSWVFPTMYWHCLCVCSHLLQI